MAREWTVYIEPPFGGPEKLLEYLSQYTHRVAISNDRIESYENHLVTFRWRDYRRRNEVRRCTLDAVEFLRRFLLHVPPSGFVRIRSYGFLGNRNRKQNLERARRLIGKTVPKQSVERFQPLRLCPTCHDRARDKSALHFAPTLQNAPQLALTLRPPPLHPVAA